MKRLLSSLSRVFLTVLVFCLSQHCWLVTHHCLEVDFASEVSVAGDPYAPDHTERDLPEPHQHGRGPILAFVAQSNLHEKLHPVSIGLKHWPQSLLGDLSALEPLVSRLSSAVSEAFAPSRWCAAVEQVLECARSQAPPPVC